MEGFIKIYRKFRKWEWYDNSFMVHLWIHLLMEANHEDVQWHGLTIGRGQLITSRERLAQETRITEQKIRTCLKRLEECSQINIKSTKRGTLITICNYESYQQFDFTTNQQLTNDQPTTNQQLTNNKNDKNEKNNNINISNNNSAHAYTREEDADDLTWLSDYWNEHTAGKFNAIPDLTDSYVERSYYAKRLLANWGEDKIKEAIDKMAASPYLTSVAQRRYATFDWLLGRDMMNIEKVLSGNYDELYGGSNTATITNVPPPEERKVTSRGVEPIRRLSNGQFIDATGVIFKDELRMSLIGLEDESEGKNGYEPRKLIQSWMFDPQYGMHGETTYNGKRYWLTRWHTIVADGKEVKV